MLPIGYVLKNTNTDELRYYHSSANNTMDFRLAYDY